MNTDIKPIYKFAITRICHTNKGILINVKVCYTLRVTNVAKIDNTTRFNTSSKKFVNTE